MGIDRVLLPDPDGDDFERALCGAALYWPTFLEDLPEMPKAEDLRVPGAFELWTCILQCKTEMGRVVAARVYQLMAEMGMDRQSEAAADLIAMADPDLVQKESAIEGAAYLCARALKERAMRVAAEFRLELARKGPREAMGLIERFEQQVSDLARVTDHADAWDFGDAVNSDRAPCVPTGLPEIDDLMGGLPLGVPGVIAARPSIGKSALACVIAQNVANQGFGVGIFSMDMPAYDLQCRMASARCYIPRQIWGGNTGNAYYQPFLQGTMHDSGHLYNMKLALAEVRKLPIAYDSRHGLTITQIRKAARRLKLKMERAGTPLRLLIVDHIGHISAERNRGGNRASEMTDVTAGLLGLARELEDVAVLELSQLSRNVESRSDKRPMLADLRESGSVEQDATWVAFLYRDEYYADRRSDDAAEPQEARRKPVERNTMEFIVAKQRNGPIGTCKLFCEMGANAILSDSVRSKVRAA